MSLKNKSVLLLKQAINHFPRFSAVCRSVREELACSREPLSTPWGFKLAGHSAMARGTFEPEETELVRALLSEVDILVNIGANIGYYCCHALSMGIPVVAFEPIPRNLRFLCQNIHVNNWKDIEIYPLALSNHTGILEIFGGNTAASVVKGWAGIPEHWVTLVPSSTLDTVLGTRLCGKRILVILDVEGAERWVLEGATHLVTCSPKPTWLVEISVTEHQPQGVHINPHLTDTFKYMFEAGYQAKTANREMALITMAQVEAVQRGEATFTTHNFLFC